MALLVAATSPKQEWLAHVLGTQGGEAFAMRYGRIWDSFWDFSRASQGIPIPAQSAEGCTVSKLPSIYTSSRQIRFRRNNFSTALLHARWSPRARSCALAKHETWKVWVLQALHGGATAKTLEGHKVGRFHVT